MSFVSRNISSDIKKFIIAIILLLLLSCRTIKKTEEAEKSIPLKYPVVLVHGINVTDRGKKIKSWGRIPEELEKKE